MAMKKKPKKGVAGKGTGGKARKAISMAQKRGASLKSIGAASNRSASTISQIAQGSIKNPPRNLATNVSKAKSKKKKKRGK